MPPPASFTDAGQLEVGGAITSDSFWDPTGQVWVYQALTDRSQAGFTAGLFQGVPTLGAAYQKINRARRLGVAIEGGLVYVRVGMPVLFPLGDRSTIYLRPTVGAEINNPVILPIGYEAAMGKGVFRLEAGSYLAPARDLTNQPIYVAAGGGLRF